MSTLSLVLSFFLDLKNFLTKKIVAKRITLRKSTIEHQLIKELLKDEYDKLSTPRILIAPLFLHSLSRPLSVLDKIILSNE
jgi:hypothetical protein